MEEVRNLEGNIVNFPQEIHRAYERKIKKLKTNHLPYETLNINADDDESDNDSDSFWSG